MHNRFDGCTVQLRLLTGDPHGVKILRRARWDGYALAVPRADVETARELEKLNKGGTVILLGSTTDNRARVSVSAMPIQLRRSP